MATRWRAALVVAAALLAAAAGTMVAVAVNAATSGSAGWFRVIERHSVGWALAGTVLVAGSGLLVWVAQRSYDRSLKGLVPSRQLPEPWVVDRPAEVSQVIAALRQGAGGTVGITTSVQGAGGFGKTTVAKVVRADPRVLRHYRGLVYWVTVGRDAGKEALPGLVNGLIAQLEPGRAVSFTDARQAGEHLAAILARGPRRLLILDDVWTTQQLAAFPIAGKCARLVTTRIPSLTVGTDVPVKIDQMTERQARALLLAGLPPLPAAVTAGLLDETGRWPLLVRLVNKILATQAGLRDAGPAAQELLGQLRGGGALEVDHLMGSTGRVLDINDPEQRSQAVSATITASTSLLSPEEHDRFAELAIFAEDETVPVGLIAALWEATGSLDVLGSGALLARLADLALLSANPSANGGTVTIHDVIRDYLGHSLGSARLAQIHGTLVDKVAAGLARSPAVTGDGMVTAWWELPARERYLRDHLIEHLLGAGRRQDAVTVSTDLRWAAARLEQAGPAALQADLTVAGTWSAERLRRLVGQFGHLLAATDPPHSLTDIFYSRVSHDNDWGPQARALGASRKLPALRNAWPLPDLPAPTLRRTLVGHVGVLDDIVIASDGTWLVASSDGRVAQVWDTATGELRATLTGHTGSITAIAIAPDNSWLATTSHDQTTRLWDAATGELRATLTGHTRSATDVAIAPDGTWLATVGDETVRIWDAATGKLRATLTGHTRPVKEVAIAPDGTWLATMSEDETVRLWDVATRRLRITLPGHNGAVSIAPDSTWLATAAWRGTARIWGNAGQLRAVLNRGVTSTAISPDGTWLATAGEHEVRIWDVRTWDANTLRLRTTLPGHTWWRAGLAIAPDGTWLAIAGDQGVQMWEADSGQLRATITDHKSYAVAIAPDGSWLATKSDAVRLWDAPTGRTRTSPTGQTGPVSSVNFAPDGSWLATTSQDSTPRLWDAATGQLRATLTGHTDQVTQLAIAPDGEWIATIGWDQTTRLWDAATGQLRATLTGHTDEIAAVAIAPDATWLVTVGNDRTARLWEAATGRLRATLNGHASPVSAVTIAPDGSWLATGGWDQTTRLWDAASGQLRATLTGHTDWITAVAIAPDGTWLATTSRDGTTRVWGRGGRLRATLANDGAGNAVAIGHDGSWLATTCRNGKTLIWDSAGGLRANLTGHSMGPAPAISPDSAWIATVDGESVRIWDTSTGHPSALMRVDSSLIDCAWSPSNRLLAAASEAGIYLFAFNS